MSEKQTSGVYNRVTTQRQVYQNLARRFSFFFAHGFEKIEDNFWISSCVDFRSSFHLLYTKKHNPHLSKDLKEKPKGNIVLTFSFVFILLERVVFDLEESILKTVSYNEFK